MTLNFGSGDNRLNNCINIDISKVTKPDIVCDVTGPLPFDSDTVDKIYFIHTIEHIHKSHHFEIFKEFNRVMKSNRNLVLAYPEFSKCATNWIENKKGMREFWEATIFGRQLWPSDAHVCAMNTSEVVELLSLAGFGKIKFGAEPEGDYYTILVAEKVSNPHNYESVVAREIFD